MMSLKVLQGDEMEIMNYLGVAEPAGSTDVECYRASLQTWEHPMAPVGSVQWFRTAQHIREPQIRSMSR